MRQKSAEINQIKVQAHIIVKGEKKLYLIITLLILGTLPLKEKFKPYSEDDDNVEYAIPPAGNSPVKHSPILPKKERNTDTKRNQIKKKFTEVKESLKFS